MVMAIPGGRTPGAGDGAVVVLVAAAGADCAAPDVRVARCGAGGLASVTVAGGFAGGGEDGTRGAGAWIAGARIAVGGVRCRRAVVD